MDAEKLSLNENCIISENMEESKNIFYIYKVKKSLEKPGKSFYICNKKGCNKTFMSFGHIINHLKSHQFIKMFVCPYCQKIFNEKGNLKIHIRIHTNERPYVCTICKKAFKTVGHLKEHKFSHTGLKPFQCPVCKKFYRRRGILKEHMKFHFKEDFKSDSSNTKDLSYNLMNIEILEKIKEMKLNINLETLKGFVDEETLQTLSNLLELHKSLNNIKSYDYKINCKESKESKESKYINIQTEQKYCEAKIKAKSIPLSKSYTAKKESTDNSSLSEVKQSLRNEEKLEFNELKNEKEPLIFDPECQNIKEYLQIKNEYCNSIFSDKNNEEEILKDNFTYILDNKNISLEEDENIKDNQIESYIKYNNSNYNRYYYSSFDNDNYDIELLKHNNYHY